MVVSESRKRAVAKYVKKAYDDIKVRVKKGKREEYRKEAEKQGKSLNRFIIDAIEKEIEK